MKKLITILLVAMVPFFTMAQKRSKRDKQKSEEKTKTVTTSEIKFMTIRGVALSSYAGMSGEAEMTDYEEPALMRQKLREKTLRVSFDFGSFVNNSEKKLKTTAGKLHSMTDAVNILAKEGWEFSSSDIVIDENATYYYYYMKK